MKMEERKVHIATADPSAIGLFGLAMVTLVASSQKLGWTDGTSFVLPWAIFLGAFAQLFASALDAKKGNTFGTTAFAGYGFFWLGIGMSWMIQHGMFGESMAISADTKQLGFAFVGYLIFTLFMTVGAMETHKVLFSIFALINVLFLGLAMDAFGIAAHTMHKVAGIAEFGIALFSFYGAAAAVLNVHFGKVVVPVGKPFGIFKK